MSNPNTPVRRVLLCGAYGADNLGDETMLRVILSELRRIRPELSICVITRSPEDTRRLYAVDAVHTFDFAAISREMKRAELFLHGGGSLLQNVTSRRSLHYYLSTLRLAKRCGCAVLLYGCGMGPVHGTADIRKTAKILNTCVDAITLRDEKSAELLADWGVTKPEIVLAADPVLSLDGCEDAEAEAFLRGQGLAPDGTYALFALRPWESLTAGRDALCEALRYAHEELGLTPVFMTLNRKVDHDTARDIADTAGVPCRILPEMTDAELVIGVMKRMRLVVSMRLHALLFAACAGTAAVGISYDPKVSGFAEYAGCIGCVELDGLSAEALKQCMAQELAKGPCDVSKIKSAERKNAQTAAKFIEKDEEI